MNQKSINMLIKWIGKILRIILIIVSIVNFFILEKDLVNFDDNSFLNDKMPYGRDSDDYTNIDRVNDLKKFKDIPLELYQNEGIEYFKRFFQIRIIYDIDTILGENMYYILLFIFEQLMEIVSGLNWGSLATKVEKLIDTKIESRFDDSGEETNCFSKFFIAMHSTLFYVFSVIIFIINLIFCILIVNNILEWMKNNLVETCWCWDLAIMLLYLILFYPKKCNCKENNENQKDRIKVVALIIAFIFCLVEIYTCTLSFYAIYYSFKGKTYFYYFCFDTEEACECLFSPYENDNCYIDKVKDRNINTAYYYYYYKIFLNNGSSGIFIFSIIMRIIMFIWNLAFIVNILLFPQLFSNLQKFKRIINFVRNEDGKITDLDDISIKEIHEGFKGGNKADSKENLGEKKVINLQKFIRK